MKKYNLYCFLFALAITSIMFYPRDNYVVIEKSSVKGNRPFAGVLNGETVGTAVCVDYWLNKDEMPEIAGYEIRSYGIFKLWAHPHSTKILKRTKAPN
jgi:hypothetical protein